MQVLDNNGTNFLVQKDDGSIVSKSKDSPTNKLLFQHDLGGLIESGTEIWQSESEQYTVTLTPHDGGNVYTMTVNDRPPLELPIHKKTELVSALADAYSGGSVSLGPLVTLYETTRSNMVRPDVVKKFGKALQSRVTVQEGGFLINGHLHLDYECQFTHPNISAWERSGGGVIPKSSAVNAYELGDFEADIDREITVDGEAVVLTENETEFVTRLIWAIKNTERKT